MAREWHRYATMLKYKNSISQIFVISRFFFFLVKNLLDIFKLIIPALFFFLYYDLNILHYKGTLTKNGD